MATRYGPIPSADSFVDSAQIDAPNNVAPS
jgi:hypothetical protein